MPTYSLSQQFLKQYLNSSAPTGYETSGQRIWLDYIRPYIDTYFTDTYGTYVGVVNPDAAYKVVIEAHADEISWYVNYITKEGYIYVVRNGGSDYQIAPSQRAIVHGDHGKVQAVFGWPAIHTREDHKDKVTNMGIEKIVLDCGCESEKEIAELGIHVGSVVTFDADMLILNKKYIVGRALDNRMGGFMIAEVARKIHENNKKLPFGLYVVNSVQEEVGLYGAKMIAHNIKPDLAIIVDVTHDTQSPHYNKIKEGDVACGKGPGVTYAPSVQRNVLKLIIDTALSAEIPFQRMAASRGTGTDTDAFAYSRSGIASGLLSLPLKYMHTTVEMVNQNDVEQLIELIYQCLLHVDPKKSFNYTL